jgi:hypothetical protein
MTEEELERTLAAIIRDAQTVAATGGIIHDCERMITLSVQDWLIILKRQLDPSSDTRADTLEMLELMRSLPLPRRRGGKPTRRGRRLSALVDSPSRGY